ncbi:MAG: 23S rRNA (pseudouridine(1915)-N(3))-methyltransferase RlmH, partial [Burkholderiaceae bacterium]|nr:23S rRNA (pseudouridine(1915)-N(3))-methyltransferase RlmH [Burkholderiaceae bacterium]
MHIAIVAVGQRLPRWAEEAVAEYLGRFPPQHRPRLIDVRPEPRDGRPLARLLAAEGQRLREAIPPGHALVALDERGREFTSAALAQQLQRWRDAAQPVAFAIGGADGLDNAFKQAAALQMRLSALTLPHALARVL